MFAVLVALGTWQLQRKAWKEALIATLNERLAAPPEPLPAPATWATLDRDDAEYRRVAFTATFDDSKEALVYAAASAFRPDVSGPGDWVFTPARLPDGRVLMVNRGFVPQNLADPTRRPGGHLAGPVAITGVLRWPDPTSWFTPHSEPAHNLWFVRDPTVIAAAKRFRTLLPFMSSRKRRCRREATRSLASSRCGCATNICSTWSPGTGWRWF